MVRVIQHNVPCSKKDITKADDAVINVDEKVTNSLEIYGEEVHIYLFHLSTDHSDTTVVGKEKTFQDRRKVVNGDRSMDV